VADPLKLDEELKERIRTLAGRKDARQNFANEAASSWAAYVADGLHVTGEEVEAWLDGWGTEAETELPACHE